MRNRSLTQFLVALVVSVLLGYAATTGVMSSAAAQPGEKKTASAEKAPAPPPGSPASTAPLDGRYLPNPPAPFGGTINLNAFQSRPFWQPRVVPPKGAPNVLVIMTDDVGFGAPSTFGGVIPTPSLDRIAKLGLRYTNFHSTALCSPTRAALITGRNHHSVGFGVVSEASTGYPGYNSVIGRDCSTIGTVLRDNGFGTSWFGKNHNTPDFAGSMAGPFDQWPVGMGFEYFYGFVGGDTSQWQPNLFRNTSRVEPPAGRPGWNLTTAMADEAVGWLHEMNAAAPDKPFFCYYVPGGTHAPHHPTPEWIKTIGDLKLFDEGWNKLRERIFANQKRLGVIPPSAELTPWPTDLLKEWDALSADEKKLFIRQAEVYAAYLAYTDHEIGRVIQAVEDLGKLDNTIIVYISGDNGSSPEGSPNGTPNEVAQFNGIEFPVARQLAEYYDAWGSDRTFGHMAVGWTWAFSTPFKWTKQMACHFGGTRQGMCVAWPARIKDAGGVRHQFHHVIDVVPTLLEAAGLPAPVSVNGIGQRPIEGVSMGYTFDPANAAVPSRRRTQYFEMMGNRALYHEGWVAGTTPIQPPWVLAADPPPDAANGYKWELYDVTKDWTQNRDLAKENPAKLRELQELFLVEAAKYQVLPLDNSRVSRMLTPRPSATAGRDTFAYARPVAGIPHGDAPSVLNGSYRITADIDVPAGGAEGMLNTNGGRFGGYGLYLHQGKPTFTYNLADLARFKWQGKDALAPGRHAVEFDFTYDGPGPARGGTGVLKVDGAAVATQKVPASLGGILQWDETFDVGSDTGTPVDDRDYRCPFPLTARLHRLTVRVGPSQMLPPEKKAAERRAGERD
jgi:arylsulfatase A-like enzyme